MSQKFIKVRGAKENNLKNIDVDIPKNKFIVITGVSGSGKSSLAFDTIYAEGQRRYLQSLPSYARQFLGGIEKPNVESIEGLSPSVSVDQKSISHNPRSTVGTVTEIFDYLRVLYARTGKAFCPNCNLEIKQTTLNQIVDTIFSSSNGQKIYILSPIAINNKGTFKNEIEQLRSKGFLRVKIDGKIISLDEPIKLEKNIRHNIDVVVDRIVVQNDEETISRIYSSLEIASEMGKGKIFVHDSNKLHEFNQKYSCNKCDFSLSEKEPRLFSFNSPIGYCDYCKGLGYTNEPWIEAIIPNSELSINEGAIAFYQNSVSNLLEEFLNFKQMLEFHEIPLNKPIKEMSSDELEYIYYGPEESPISVNITNSRKINKYWEFSGIIDAIKKRYFTTNSLRMREYCAKFMLEQTCKKCNGKRLNNQALSVKINGFNIIELTNMSVTKILNFFESAKFDKENNLIAEPIIKEINNRLQFMKNVGLDYLTLSRSTVSLSGGESQRIRLASQIGSNLTGVLYVLDEPSIGLHQRDNLMLINTLKSLRDLGNTVIVVEHDQETMTSSDYIIDIGPKAGQHGGQIVGLGIPKEFVKNSNSLTAEYLRGDLSIQLPKKKRGNICKKIVINGACGNNLKKINVTFFLNTLTVITGVSGSGKSTLVNETLVKIIQKEVMKQNVVPKPYTSVQGLQNIDKVVKISQDPIGRTPRSNPATYVGVFDDIRELFAQTSEAKIRGYNQGRFSFNVPGGRCEHCYGDGLIKVEMHFLPDVFIKCEECNGKKYNNETLSVKYKNKSIYDVLEMTAEEALKFFFNIPNINRKLQLLVDVGLGYLKLGTNALVLSGGEAQRIKLSKHLQKRATGKTLFVLDEPTTGLHNYDVNNLVQILNRIVENNNTVIVIEHNLDLIKTADWIIDLGPEGGENGGKVVFAGTVNKIVESKGISHTGRYLKKHLESH